jgi:cysteine-rich repeat protein
MIMVARGLSLSGFGVVAMTALVMSCTGDEPVLSGGDPGNDSGTQDDGGTNPNCINGDGTCGADCNALNDDDCKPVCGNRATEPGEICDDGNQDNGDGCDPTCQFTNKVSILSGKAGALGSADDTGTDARFNQPVAITTDGTDLYMADLDDQTIKKITPAGVVTTIAGGHRVQASVDGTGAAARFDDPEGIAFLNGALYVSELTTLRKVDLATMAVTTIAGSGIFSGAGGGGASLRSDGTNLIWVQSGSVRGYNPATGGSVTIATAANVTAASGAGSTGLSVVHRPGSVGTPYWVGTARNVVRCPGASGNCTLVAGSTTLTGCVGDQSMPADARMSTVRGGAVTANNNFFFFDLSCNAVRTVGTQVQTHAGSLTVSGYVDGAGSSSGAARFHFISSMTAIGQTLYLVETGAGQGTLRRVVGTLSGGNVDVSTFAGSADNTINTIVYAATGADVRYPTLPSSPVNAITVDETDVYGVVGFSPSTLFKVSLATGGAASV